MALHVTTEYDTHGRPFTVLLVNHLLKVYTYDIKSAKEIESLKSVIRDKSGFQVTYDNDIIYGRFTSQQRAEKCIDSLPLNTVFEISKGNFYAHMYVMPDLDHKGENMEKGIYGKNIPFSNIEEK